MRIRNIIMLLFLTTTAVGQQINPVPDYIFRNQMSVGRNAPTDTAAYLSIGPRFGANRGIMPPMVVDTNAVTGVKRNGLLIFSVQLNNFAYWDSTTSRFRRITAEAVVDSLQFATRAWRRKGDDSLAAIINQRTDTALISTRAYRQKGVDSLVTLISTLGGGTVLSVSAGTGMNFTTITTSGSVSADTNVLSTRAWRRKGDDSLGAVIAGKVNISDTATMLSAYLRRADTTSMLSPYLRKTDTTAMLTPYVRNAGFGLTKGTQSLSVDSALMATRARVQKGIDSVASLVTTIDSLTFSTRAWRQKGVDSVAALANTKATATGTTNYLSKFTGTNSLGNSIVYATTSEVGISTPSPTESLDVNGRVRVRTIDSTATGMNMLYADASGVIKKAAIPAGGSGSVTSVSAGTGMSFTTITTTGSISADTVALSTRAWRQKGIDSLANVRVGGSGTTNRVAKFTASGTIGNTAIYENNNLTSIGRNPPFANVPFTVSDSSTGAGQATIFLNSVAGGADQKNTAIQHGSAVSDAFRIRFLNDAATDGTNAYIITRSGTQAQTHEWITGTNERMRITSGGNVGIGTTSPDSRLSVTGDGTGIIRMGSGVGGNSATIGLTGAISSTNYTLSGDAGNSNLAINRPTGGAMSFRSNGSAQMTLTSAGRLLVGTETEGTFGLDVNATARTGTLTINTSGTGRTISTIIPAGSLGDNFFAGGGGGSASYTSGDHGSQNASLGVNALFSTTTGNRNTAIGNAALRDLTTGERNVAVGSNALVVNNGTSNVAVGRIAGQFTTAGGNNTGSNQSIFIGDDSRPSGSSNFNEIVIGFSSRGNGQNTTTIGNTSTTDTYLLGRLDIGTIDSTSSPINMLTSDVNGVIRKAAIPTAASVDTNTIATRARVQKAVDSINNVNASGTGISGYINRWSGSKTMDTSQIFQQANRIGIGTTTPDARLVVVGDGTGLIRIGGGVGGNTASIGMTGAISSTAYTLAGDPGTGNVTLNRPSGGALSFAHANTEQARFDGNGTFLINTTTSDANVRLRVNGRARVETIDSSAGPINMLWADVDGNIRKAAVPSGGSGSVTSVAAGTGMSFSTITTTGSVSADTAILATRAWSQKGIDSLAASEVSISDTATMLSPYVRIGGIALSKSGQTLNVDTIRVATRAWRQKGIDSLANVRIAGVGGTTNRVPRYTASGTIGNGSIVDERNTEAVRILSSGLVGIGITAPNARLSVAGDGTGQIRIGGGVGGNTASIGMTGTISTTAYTLSGDAGTGNVTLNRPTGGVLAFSLNNSEQARFDANGTLLIGSTTSDANVRLRVNGRARVETIDSSAGPINMLWADVNGNIRKAAVPSGGLSGSGTANYVPLFTSSTALGNSSIYEASSEVLIGTTSDAGAFKLQVNGVTYSSGGIRTDAPSGGTAQTWKFGSAIADSVALDANNYLEVEVNGVFYRIALITLL